MNGLRGGRRTTNTGPAEGRFLEAIDIEAPAGGVDHEGDVMPLIIGVSSGAQRACPAVVDVVGRVAEIPRAQAAVVEEHLIAIRGPGNVLVDDPAHAGARTRLDPYGDRQRIRIERPG